jgi:hypothetical protein
MDRHFLIIYDRRHRELILEKEYPDADTALDARFDAEREANHDPNVEIVVLHSDSPETLRKTHSRYFRHADRPAPDYLEPTRPADA